MTRRTSFLFITPAAIVVLAIVAYPLGYAIWLSLTNSRVGSPGHFIGLGNYISLFQDSTFLRTVGNTLVYTLGGLVVKLALGLVVALALNRIRIGRNVVSGVLLFPWIIPTVISSLVWKWMLDGSSTGIINYVLVNLHLVERPVDWLGTSTLAMLSVIMVGVWREVPFFGISLLAGLQGIPRDQYEAASLDGATWLQTFWNVTIPNLRGIMLLVSVLSAVQAAYDFTLIWTLTQGRPGGATHLLSTLSFEQGFSVGELARAVAIALVAFPLIAPVVLWVARIIERQES
jgi:multiple sugar transport system permease protein